MTGIVVIIMSLSGKEQTFSEKKTLSRQNMKESSHSVDFMIDNADTGSDIMRYTHT